MPAATSKSDLIAISAKEFGKLQTCLDAVPQDLRLTPDEDRITVKDIVGHRAHWIELFLGWYADGQAEKEVFFPAKGYKWNASKHYNADLRAAQSGMGWEDARDMLARNHTRLMSWIDGLSDQELYGGPMKGANNAWSPGRWAEAAGASHYRSATKYVRTRIRAHVGHV